MKYLISILTLVTAINSYACPNALRLSKTGAGAEAIQKFEAEYKKKFLGAIIGIGLVPDQETIQVNSRAWHGSDIGARKIKTSVLLNDGTNLVSEDIYLLYSDKIDTYDKAGNLTDSQCLLKGALYGTVKIKNAKTYRTVSGFEIEFNSVLIP